MSEPAWLGRIINRYTNSRLRQIITILEYTFLILYFGFLWVTANSESALTSRYIADLIFIQFFGHLVTVMVAIQIGGQYQRLVRWLFVFIYGGLGLWIMLDLTEGWLTVVIWVVSVTIGLMRNPDNVLGNSLAEGIWLIIAAFFAALVGSIASVPEADLLTDNIGTTAGWGILFYIGLLFVEIADATSPESNLNT